MFAADSDRLRLSVTPESTAGLYRADIEFAGASLEWGGEIHRTSGLGFREDEAILAAVGEVLERYAAGQVPEEHLISGTAEELGESAVAPESFPLFSDDQYARRDFPFERFTAKTRLRWAPGDRLSDGTRVYLPAQLVHLLAHQTFDDVPIGYATSSGMACRPTRDEAILAGLLELVERDGLMLAWYNRLALPLLEIESVACELHEVRRMLDTDHAQYVLVNLSDLAGIPVALCVRSADTALPGITVGAASAPTIALAARKAIAESFQTRSFVLRAGAAQAASRPEITTFAEHAFFHAYPPRPGIAEFLVASADRVRAPAVPAIPGGSARESIDAIVRRLAAFGCEVYVVDTTPRDPFFSEVRSVTVVSPQLCRLDVGHALRYLGNDRLWRAPYELGLVPALGSPSGLNPEPHPLG